MRTHHEDTNLALAEPEAPGIPTAPMTSAALGLRSWGWPVTVSGTSLLLRMTGEFCAVELPQPHAELMLRRLGEVDARGPVIHTLRPEPWLIFLAEADTVVDSSVLAPYRARLLQHGDTVALPPASSHAGRATWVLAPRPDHRWLPRLSTLVWALRKRGPVLR